MRFVRYFTHKVDFLHSQSAFRTLFHAQSGLPALTKCVLCAISRIKWTSCAQKVRFVRYFTHKVHFRSFSRDPVRTSWNGVGQIGVQNVRFLKPALTKTARSFLDSKNWKNPALSEGIFEVCFRSPKCANFSRCP